MRRAYALVVAVVFAVVGACSAGDGGLRNDSSGGAGGTAGSAGNGTCDPPTCGSCEGCFDLCLCATADANQCLSACGATSTGVCAAPDCSGCGSCMDVCMCAAGDATACAQACGQGSGGTGGGAGVGGSGPAGTGGVGGGTAGTAGAGAVGGGTGGCADDGSGWNAQWQQWECQVLDLTNQRRAQGAVCGGQPYGPVGPLTMQPQLRYSARGHAKDMGDHNFFDHTNLQGLSPFDRMAAAGYQGQTMGENIAAGQSTPESVVAGWMNSPGHCTNIMNGQYTDLGVGYYYSGSSQYGHLWVQNFGG